MRALLILPCLLLACQPDQPDQPEPVAPAAPEPVAAQPAVLSHEVLLTGGATVDQELPLLVAVHGMGSRPERFAGAFAALDTPARVILPLAPHPTASGGGSWFPFRRNETDRETFGQHVYEASAEVVALLDWAEGHYPTRGEPVITGFSQGGMVSFAVASGWPDHIAAALPVGGDLSLSLVPQAAPSDPPPVIAFHGTADDVVPIAPVVQAVEALQAVGYDATLHSYDGVKHSISDAMRADWLAALATHLGSEPAAEAQARAAGCPPLDRPTQAMPAELRIPLGARALVVDSCSRGRDVTAVRARLEGGDWTWVGDYAWDEPSFENEVFFYQFEHGGQLAVDTHVLVLHYTTCDVEGCDLVRFYTVDARGQVSILADELQATGWGAGPDGAFHYVERTGYSIGYHIASAEWTYRWNGASFERQPEPVLTAEYANWPCQDSEVQPVDPATGQPSGDPVPVKQGAPIEVLAVDPEHPSMRFEYRVSGQRFWADDWQQICAG
jgi:phospholipase/carboxylesterase